MRPPIDAAQLTRLLHTTRTRPSAVGRLSVRQRLDLLLDNQESFLELSPLAGHELYDFPTPAGGIITGIGQVAGKTCMILANDFSVKAGAYLPITLKKHRRAQAIAAALRLPTLYLVDSAGAHLPSQEDLFADAHHFGSLFAHQARMAAQGIPQLALVHGPAVAGGAYIPAMCGQIILVANQGQLSLAGSPLVEAATGEKSSPEELGGAHTHGVLSGLVDAIAADDQEALTLLRAWVSRLPQTQPSRPGSFTPPREDPETILDYLPTSPGQPCAMHQLLAHLIDAHNWLEFKPNYGPSMLTGWAHLHGHPLGIVAANGVLTSDAVLKALQFIRLCGRTPLPLLFIHNTAGFLVGREAEVQGLAKHGAALVATVTTYPGPKISLVVGGSFGAGNYALCGRGMDPDFLFTWPTARFAVMGPEQAAQVMGDLFAAKALKAKKPLDEDTQAAYRQGIAARVEACSHALYATARLWDDGLLDPRATRHTLAWALHALQHKPCLPWAEGISRY